MSVGVKRRSVCRSRRPHPPGRRWWMAPLLAAVACGALWGPLAAEAQEQEREADHEALRELRRQFTAALNERDFEALQPLVTDSVAFITINNEKVNGLDELKDYWEELFEGEDSVVVSLTVDPEADDLTTFYGDDVGVAQGTSNDVFVFRTVGRRELVSRWTAVVVKEDGQWKVARAHMSADVLENPVLEASRFMGNLKLGAGALAGLLLGGLLVWWLRKK